MAVLVRGPTKKEGGTRDRHQQSLSGGQFRARARRGHGDRAGGDRSRTRGLSGRYLRNGPNPVSRTGTIELPLVHRRRDGPRDPPARRPGRVVPQPLGTFGPGGQRSREEPRPGPVHAGMDFAPNTNVIGHAGRTFAIVEAGARPYGRTERARDDRPVRYRWHARRAATRPTPSATRLTGELYAVSYFFGWGNDVEVTVIDTRRRRCVRRRRVAMGGPVSVHDCAITQRSIVLLDLPVTFSLDAAAIRCVVPYRWEEGYRARIGLLPGTASRPRWSGTTSNPATCSTR